MKEFSDPLFTRLFLLITKGLAKGMAEGMEKGREDERCETAAKLKALGVALSIISQATGEVENL